MKYLAAVLSMFAIQAHAFCFEQAGLEHNINPQLLRAIAQVESSMNPRAVNESHLSRTKTKDIGVMQINSSALAELAKEGITEKRLLEEPCLNVRIGARILAQKFKQIGANWEGVGAYNAACVVLKGDECKRARNAYTTKVWKALNQGQSLYAAQIDTKDELVRLGDAGKSMHSSNMSTRIESIEIASSDSASNIE